MREVYVSPRMARSEGGAGDGPRPERTMDASEVRQSFARVLDSVRREQKPVIIERYGRPIAALVPLASLRAPEAWRRPPARPGGRPRRKPGA